MIYVLRTSVKLKKDVRKLRLCLNELLKQSKWNFDLGDCDKVLRIDSQTEILQVIINLLQDKDFDCEELK
jgi:hypothetical protein